MIKVFRKGLVFGIIVLFVGASIIPIFSSAEISDSVKVNENNSMQPIIDIDLVFTENVSWWSYPIECGKEVTLNVRVIDLKNNYNEGDDIEVYIENCSDELKGIGGLSDNYYGWGTYILGDAIIQFPSFKWLPKDEGEYWINLCTYTCHLNKYNEINPDNNHKTLTASGKKSKDIDLLSYPDDSENISSNIVLDCNIAINSVLASPLNSIYEQITCYDVYGDVKDENGIIVTGQDQYDIDKIIYTNNNGTATIDIQLFDNITESSFFKVEIIFVTSPFKYFYLIVNC